MKSTKQPKFIKFRGATYRLAEKLPQDDPRSYLASRLHGFLSDAVKELEVGDAVRAMFTDAAEKNDDYAAAALMKLKKQPLKGAAANLFSALSLFREYYENRMSELKDEAAAKAWYEKVRSAMKGQG